MSTEFAYTPEWVHVDDCPQPAGFTGGETQQWFSTAVSGWVISMCLVEDAYTWDQALMFRQYEETGSGLSPVGPWIEVYRTDANLSGIDYGLIGLYLDHLEFGICEDPNGYCVALFHETGDAVEFDALTRNHVVTVKPTGSGAALVDHQTIQTAYTVIAYNNLHQISQATGGYVIVSGGEWYDPAFEWEYPTGFFVEGFDVNASGLISLHGRLLKYEYGTNPHDVRVEGVAAGTQPGYLALAVSSDYDVNPGRWGWAWVECSSTFASITKIEDQASGSDAFYQYATNPRTHVEYAAGSWSTGGFFQYYEPPMDQITAKEDKNTAWEGTPSYMIYTLSAGAVNPDPAGDGWKTDHVHTAWDDVHDYNSTSLPGHPGYPPRTPPEPLLSMQDWWEPGSNEVWAVSSAGRLCLVTPAYIRGGWTGPEWWAPTGGYRYLRSYSKSFMIVVDAFGGNPRHAFVDDAAWTEYGAGMVAPGGLYALGWNWDTPDYDWGGSLWCAKVPIDNPNLSATAGPNRRYFQRAIPTK